MDDSGNWHNAGPTLADKFRQAHDEAEGKTVPERPVITCGIGETVYITQEDGTYGGYRFEGAEKNRVTLSSIGGMMPYFDFGSKVTMHNAAKETCKAQVWDNRGGKLILRTLPLYS